MDNTAIPNGMDAGAVNLARAIRQQESGGDYTKSGDGGSSLGAYQWNNQPNGKSIPLQKGEIPSNFQTDAKAAGLDPNDFSAKNQDMVAYTQIKKYKDEGYNVPQIAALWNGGDAKREDPNYVTPSGLPSQKKDANGKDIYNVPAYAQSVNNTYQALKQKTSETGNGYVTPPPPIQTPDISDTTSDTTNTPTNQPESLGSELQGRAGDISSAISDTQSGKINPISGIIQGVGAVAGGINDVAQKGLELIPGVKSVEGLIGKGVGALANTSTGQKVTGAIGNFTQAHPELSSDIGAVGNIAGAAGLVTGAGALKDVAGEGIAKVLGSDATSASEKELSEVASRTVTGRKLLQSQPDALKILAQPEFKPAQEVIGGVNKYVTKDSSSAIDGAIKDIDENKLQPLLDKNNTNSVADKLPLQTYRNTAIAQAKDALIDDGGINKLFDRIQTKYGDYPSLSQMNEAKRLVAKQITDSAFGSDTYTTAKIVRNSLQKGIEDGANKLGLGDVNAINKEMRALYQADDYLKTIDGKAVKVSRFSKLKSGVLKTVKHGVIEGLAGTAGYEAYKHISGQ